jgi:hypothetical protein
MPDVIKQSETRLSAVVNKAGEENAQTIVHVEEYPGSEPEDVESAKKIAAASNTGIEQVVASTKEDVSSVVGSDNEQIPTYEQRANAKKALDAWELEKSQEIIREMPVGIDREVMERRIEGAADIKNVFETSLSAAGKGLLDVDQDKIALRSFNAIKSVIDNAAKADHPEAELTLALKMYEDITSSGMAENLSNDEKQELQRSINNPELAKKVKDYISSAAEKAKAGLAKETYQLENPDAYAQAESAVKAYNSLLNSGLIKHFSEEEQATLRKFMADDRLFVPALQKLIEEDVDSSNTHRGYGWQNAAIKPLKTYEALLSTGLIDSLNAQKRNSLREKVVKGNMIGIIGSDTRQQALTDGGRPEANLGLLKRSYAALKKEIQTVRAI